MTALKYSRQRESIKHFLANTTSHPTADNVYMHVRNEFPNISLGTVYRNLNLLVDLGEARRITAPDGGDRFDGQMTPHNHFFCTCCGDVSDLFLNSEIFQSLNQAASADFDGIIESNNITFYGKCSKCLQKAKNRAG